MKEERKRKKNRGRGIKIRTVGRKQNGRKLQRCSEREREKKADIQVTWRQKSGGFARSEKEEGKNQPVGEQM